MITNLNLLPAGFEQIIDHSPSADHCEAHHLHGGSQSQPQPHHGRPERGIYQGVCLGGRQVFRTHR